MPANPASGVGTRRASRSRPLDEHAAMRRAGAHQAEAERTPVPLHREHAAPAVVAHGDAGVVGAGLGEVGVGGRADLRDALVARVAGGQHGGLVLQAAVARRAARGARCLGFTAMLLGGVGALDCHTSPATPRHVRRRRRQRTCPDGSMTDLGPHFNRVRSVPGRFRPPLAALAASPKPGRPTLPLPCRSGAPSPCPLQPRHVQRTAVECDVADGVAASSVPRQPPAEARHQARKRAAPVRGGGHFAAAEL